MNKQYPLILFVANILGNGAEEDLPNANSRFTVTGTGQEVADIFIGAAWSQFPGSEFVGGLADVYRNKQGGINPVVDTEFGKLRGIVSVTSRNKTPYSAFMGIPFAKPPLNHLRFKAPEPPEAWEHIRDATYERSTCLTFREPNKGNEDCLYLNVFTPTTSPDSTQAFPVLVFIYGGAFMGGSSNTSGYSPDFLLDKEAIVVTFNYRIGPLGFLSLQNNDVPGNAGLKDQVMALRWVKRNIENFGGEAKKVMIFGESAGSASVSYHVISPSSRGLFDRAIMESGTSLATWAYTDPKTALEKAFTLGRRIGCTLSSALQQADQLYDCLKSAPGPLLTRSQPVGLSLQEILAMRPLAFVPTAEPDFPGAMITKDPIEYLASGEFSRVPTVMGVNTAEGLLFYPVIRKLGMLGSGVLLRVLGRDLTNLLPRDLNVTVTPQQRTDINQRMHQFYSNNSNSTLTALQFLQIISDTQFLLPMLRTADLMVADNSREVYVYQFSYDGPYTCYKTDDDMKKLNGTCHMDELGYIFNLGPIKKSYNHSDRNKPEEKVVDLLTGIWRHFAETGEPEEEPAIWKPFSRDEPNYCELSIEAKPHKFLEKQTVHFWNGIYKMVTGKSVFRGYDD